MTRRLADQVGEDPPQVDRSVPERRDSRACVELEMFDELVKRGFRVEPQVPCGGYRIDFAPSVVHTLIEDMISVTRLTDFFINGKSGPSTGSVKDK